MPREPSEPENPHATQPTHPPAGADPGAQADDTSHHRSPVEAAQRAKERAHETMTRLEAARPRSRLIDGFFRSTELDGLSGGSVLSAALAFRVFLLLVPFVVVLVAGLGLAADAGGASPRTVATQAGIAGLAARSISDLAHEQFATRLTAFVVASFALFLAARAAIKVIRLVYGLVWQVNVPRIPRPTRAALFLIGAMLIGAAFVQAVNAIERHSLLAWIVAELLIVAVPTGIWLLVAEHCPHAKGVTRRDLLPGAILFGVSVQVLRIVTVVWIAHEVETKSAVYGALGTALALLLWAYLVGRALTAAAVVDAALWFREHPPSSRHRS